MSLVHDLTVMVNRKADGSVCGRSILIGLSDREQIFATMRPLEADRVLESWLPFGCQNFVKGGENRRIGAKLPTGSPIFVDQLEWL